MEKWQKKKKCTNKQGTKDIGEKKIKKIKNEKFFFQFVYTMILSDLE